MAKPKLLIQADLEWTMYVQQRYGYTTAYVFTMLSAMAFATRKEGRREFGVPCGGWDGLKIGRHSWRAALKNLEECGAIDLCKIDRHLLVVEVTEKPWCFKKEVDHYNYADK